MAGEAGPGQKINHLTSKLKTHPLHPWLDAPSSHPQKRTIAHPKTIDVSPHGPPSAAGGCETGSDELRPKGGVGSDDDVDGWLLLVALVSGAQSWLCGTCLQCVRRLPASNNAEKCALSARAGCSLRYVLILLFSEAIVSFFFDGKSAIVIKSMKHGLWWISPDADELLLLPYSSSLNSSKGFLNPRLALEPFARIWGMGIPAPSTPICRRGFAAYLPVVSGSAEMKHRTSSVTPRQ